MKNLRICLRNHFVFNGFIVQPGMLFGVGDNGESIITNGRPYCNGIWIYTDQGSIDGEFNQVYITEESHPNIYHKIQKALRQRERKGIDSVQYRTPLQLEFERWQADPYHRHFQVACTPIGHTAKVKAVANEHSAAKYNSMKERAALTQDINICKYSAEKDGVIII